MKYRKASVDEAEQFWNLMNQLDYETKYMLYEPGERTKNLPQIESLIRDSVEGEDFLLVAETDYKLIGYISRQIKPNCSFCIYRCGHLKRLSRQRGRNRVL